MLHYIHRHRQPIAVTSMIRKRACIISSRGIITRSGEGSSMQISAWILRAVCWERTCSRIVITIR